MGHNALEGGHYCDGIMSTMASQIISISIVYSNVYSDADQRKRQSSAPLAFVRGIHRGPVNSPHKWPVTRKMYPLDDVIMKYLIGIHQIIWQSVCCMFRQVVPDLLASDGESKYMRHGIIQQTPRNVRTHRALSWYFMIRYQPVLVHAYHCASANSYHDDVIKWKHFLRYWPFVRGIHRSPVKSAHKGQWRGAMMFSLICAWINGWVNNREAGDLRRHRAHCDAIIMNSPEAFTAGHGWEIFVRSGHRS